MTNARWVELRNKMIKAIYDAGGKIMAGSDTPEFLWLYGFSQHRELKALADAGLPNYAVLAAGTRNAHEWLGSIGRSGTIAKERMPTSSCSTPTRSPISRRPRTVRA